MALSKHFKRSNLAQKIFELPYVPPILDQLLDLISQVVFCLHFLSFWVHKRVQVEKLAQYQGTVGHMVSCSQDLATNSKNYRSWFFLTKFVSCFDLVKAVAIYFSKSWLFTQFSWKMLWLYQTINFVEKLNFETQNWLLDSVTKILCKKFIFSWDTYYEWKWEV